LGHNKNMDSSCLSATDAHLVTPLTPFQRRGRRYRSNHRNSRRDSSDRNTTKSMTEYIQDTDGDIVQSMAPLDIIEPIISSSNVVEPL